jgi:glycerol-3-phosphate dehydrogenase
LRRYRLGLIVSSFVNAASSLAMFPTLAAVRGDDGAKLRGTIVYQDGQFNDTRLNVAVACTAAGAYTRSH